MRSSASSPAPSAAGPASRQAHGACAPARTDKKFLLLFSKRSAFFFEKKLSSVFGDIPEHRNQSAQRCRDLACPRRRRQVLPERNDRHQFQRPRLDLLAQKLLL